MGFMFQECLDAHTDLNQWIQVDLPCMRIKFAIVV